MKTWIIAAVGCAVGVVGCFGQVSQGSGVSGGPTPDPSGTTTPEPPGTNWPNTPAPPPPQSNAADGGDAAIAICVSDSGLICDLPDGTACADNGDCSSGLCYGDGAATGHCSEACTAQSEATVCNFGAHKCGSAGICLVGCTGAVCNLPDGQACKGDQECASDICFANGNANGGACSEKCTAANEATVCNFGQHKCSDANNGLCLP